MGRTCKGQPQDGIQLAQVNCAAHGDLCNAHNAKGYPQMNIYKDGEYKETFKGARDLSRLKDFLKKYANPSAPEPTHSVVSEEEPTQIYDSSGTVSVLDDSNF
ncbi:hypothetical protein D9758_003702 [Tetrapyrgos nigripes]|uniref:Thioredoxin domain-containing protein n=1 Tax=Tetrapyrgos nigripes TaxID=182062 RepID=A0A8H5LS40_9AGAR|nr:hypothetical protein D9758_003702 [Tetrapyrgos nigripes]